MDYAFPQWKGFERAPEGHLLDQLIDLSGPMGVAYERSVGFHKDFHAHDRAMILFPRGSCVMKVKTSGGVRRQTYTIGCGSALIVPGHMQHEDEAVTAIFDTLALYPSRSLLDIVADDEEIPAAQVTSLFSRPAEFRRSAWLDQLSNEYVFARVLSRRESAKTLAFFERQILVEVFASGAHHRKAPDRPTLPSNETVAGRAARYIEANLFSDLRLSAIAAQAFASPSTLLRHFRGEIGRSPHAYIKARRLEEARRLIEAGMHPIGDVAMLVGYENFAAFSTAFKTYFGAVPSSFRQRGRGRR